jgi:hypothetical protein
MSFLDRWFGSNDNLIDVDSLTKQYENELNKSFRAGRSTQRVDPAYIEIGANNEDTNNAQRNTINREYFIRKKDRLRGYSTDLLVQAIIRTRTNQILQYAVPARSSDDGNGFRVVRKGKKPGDMSKHEQNVAEKLEDFIFYTGKKQMDWRDDFPTFLARILYDFYVYDQINIERVYESPRSNKLNHFNYVDASTILIDKFPKTIDKPKTYVQMINRKEVAHFTNKELTFITYWSQNMNKNCGYGFSPVEAAIPQITYHINVEQFNARFFSQGGMTRGLLLIDPGDGTGTSRVSLDALRRNLMPTQGINGSWKIPIIQAHDAKYVNMTQSSKDMEFVNFLNYLNNIICADFGIDPVEVNFPNRGGANGKTGGSTLNEGNTTKTKMDASQSKGLAPVMKFIERIITDKILRYVDDRYQFIFTPSDEGKEKQKLEQLALKLKNGVTINEAREEMGYKPIDGYDIPGNSDNLIQYLAIQSKLNDPEANKVQQNSTAYKPTKDKAGADVDQDNQNNQNNVDNDKTKNDDVSSDMSDQNATDNKQNS